MNQTDTIVMKLYVYLIIMHLGTIQAQAFQVQFEDQVLVKQTNQNEFQKIASGQILNMEKDSAYYVVNSQNMPLLLISSSRSDSQFNITNRDLSSVFDEKTNQHLQSKVNEIITDIRKSESLLLKKEFAQALAIINKTKEKHKNVSAVLFLSASLQSLLNNKKMAIEDLENGLQIDPQNTSALNMLKQLKGSEK